MHSLWPLSTKTPKSIHILAVTFLALTSPLLVSAQSLSVGNCTGTPTNNFLANEPVCVGGTTGGTSSDNDALACVLPSTGGIAADDVTPDGCNSFPPASTMVDERIWLPPTDPGTYIVVLFASSEDVLQESIVIAPRTVQIDHDGDGRSDILWHDDKNGQIALWTMDGGNRLGNVAMPPVSDPSWQIVGRGDYNGDATADILWRRFKPGQPENGQMAIWLIQGGNRIANLALPKVSNDDWQVAANGDINGDRESDVLWRNVADGRNALWIINGGQVTSNIGILSASPDWEIVGDGDFDGNGKADILWRNPTTGNNAVWLMDGATRAANASLPSVAGSDWKVVGLADYGGDGRDDILWRNVANGSNALWAMNGTTRVGNYGVAAVTNLNWSIIGDGDYNGDGKADILWRQTVNGRNAVWLMDGKKRTSSQKVPTVRIGDWKPVNVN